MSFISPTLTVPKGEGDPQLLTCPQIVGPVTYRSSLDINFQEKTNFPRQSTKCIESDTLFSVTGFLLPYTADSDSTCEDTYPSNRITLASSLFTARISNAGKFTPNNAPKGIISNICCAPLVSNKVTKSSDKRDSTTCPPVCAHSTDTFSGLAPCVGHPIHRKPTNPKRLNKRISPTHSLLTNTKPVSAELLSNGHRKPENFNRKCHKVSIPHLETLSSEKLKSSLTSSSIRLFPLSKDLRSKPRALSNKENDFEAFLESFEASKSSDQRI